MAQKLGYHPDPKTPDLLAKDHDFKDLKYYLPTASGDVDLTPYTTPTNQYQLSACAGNSTADSVEVVSAIDEADAATAAGRDPNRIRELAQTCLS